MKQTPNIQRTRFSLEITRGARKFRIMQIIIFSIKLDKLTMLFDKFMKIFEGKCGELQRRNVRKASTSPSPNIATGRVSP